MNCKICGASDTEREIFKKLQVCRRCWRREYDYPRNKDKILKAYSQQRAERRKKDDVYNCIILTRNNIYDAIRRSGFKTAKGGKHTEDILGCSFKDFKLYIESKFQPGMSWNNYGLWELDHIIPIASAKTKDEVIKLNHYTNFQPLWATDNKEKRDKLF